MTVITKVITEKKGDPDKQQLVNNELDAVVVTEGYVEREGSTHVYLTLPSSRTTRCLTVNTVYIVVMSLLIIAVCVIGGLFLNARFTQAKMYRFKTWCNVPYEDDTIPETSHIFGNEALTKSQEDSSYEVSSETLTIPTSFFKEDFEMDLKYESYEKIDVPSFRGGRPGRFIHDFSSNKTGIVDLDGQRCFVMPLNRSQVLPPQSLGDLVSKMKGGYYEVDTAVVRETMRVIQPPISDYRSVGYYITKECSNLPTYRLQRMTRPVMFSKVKRSSDRSSIMFTEFAGKNIIQFEIVN